MARSLLLAPAALAFALAACSASLSGEKGCRDDSDCLDGERCGDGTCVGGADAGPELPAGCEKAPSYPESGFEVRYFALEDDGSFGACLGVQSLTADEVALSWGEAGPLAGVTDRFAARLTARRQLEQGVYRLSMSHDEGLQVFVDGELTYDGWAGAAGPVQVATPLLEGGEHELVLEYFEDTGAASLSFALTPGCVPPDAPAGSASVSYHPLDEAGAPDLSRCFGAEVVPAPPDEAGFSVSLDWGEGSPAPLQGSGVVEQFGYELRLPVDMRGLTHFRIFHDDGVRVDNGGLVLYDTLEAPAAASAEAYDYWVGPLELVVTGVDTGGAAALYLEMENVCDAMPPADGTSWRVRYYRVAVDDFALLDDCLVAGTLPSFAFNLVPDPLPEYLTAVNAPDHWGMVLEWRLDSTAPTDIVLGHDDGARVYVDDALVHDHWTAPLAVDGEELTLPAGDVVRIDYFQQLGGAFLRVQAP